MAKQRMINTRFWDDNYSSNLDPIEKLLFLYVLTNTSTNICGVYEIPLRKISSETGIEKDMVSKILDRFSADDKVFYSDGWIIIKNFIKNQNEKSPMVKKGIENEMEKVPEHIKQVLLGKGIDTLSHLIKSNLTESNIIAPAKGISEIIKSFEVINPACKKFYGNTTQRKACEDLIENYGLERVLTVVEKTLPKTNGLEFFPTITTPVQLNDKWASLESAIIKSQKPKVENKKAKVAF